MAESAPPPIVRSVKRGYLLKADVSRVEVNVQSEDATLVLDAKRGPKQIVSGNSEVWAALEAADGVKPMTEKELAQHTKDDPAPRPPQAASPQEPTASAAGEES